MARSIHCLSMVLALIITLTLPPVFANDIATEVIVTTKDNRFLAFSAINNHWVSEDKKLSERVLGTTPKGNIGIVITTKRIVGFSVLTDQWSSEDLKLNEKIGKSEITIEGNVATLKTTERVIGYSAHTGEWVEAP